MGNGIETYKCALPTCGKEISGNFAWVDIGKKLVFCGHEIHDLKIGYEILFDSFGHDAQYAINSGKAVMTVRMPVSEIREYF
jgi:hypothetical protein